MTDTAEAPQIYRLMAEVLEALPAIGKDMQNTQQGFMFRGYDQVVNALNPELGKRGLFFVPEVLERIAEVRTTRNNQPLYVVNLHVRYTFYASDGSSVVADGWGEGTDSGDKATNKAMTGALKYVLFQTFAISTKETGDSDADRTTPPETQHGAGPDVYECPECNKAGSHYEHVDVQKVRAHLVSKHGYRQLEDGRVLPPKTEARTGDPATDPGTEDLPDDGGRPLPPPKVDGPEEQKDTGTATSAPSAAQEGAKNDMAGGEAAPLNPATMSKPEVVQALRERGLPTSGRFDELRARLTGALFDEETGTGTAAVKAEESGADEGTTPPPAPAAASAPEESEPSADSPAGDVWARVREKYEIPDDAFVKDGQEHACPNCDVFAFDNEGAYLCHWYTTHGDEAEQWQAEIAEEGKPRSATVGRSLNDDMPDDGGGTPEDEDDPPANADMIAEVKRMVGSMTGTQARAYAKKRREEQWPTPEKLTMSQALELIDFLESLTASATA